MIGHENKKWGGGQTGQKSTSHRPKIDPSLSRIRSAITNGSHLLLDVDHRSARMRRLRDLIGAHLADLGGADEVSQAEACLVRRCALITIELELLKPASKPTTAPPQPSWTTYQRVAGSFRRLHESLGLRRRAKDITGPTLGQILREGIRQDREAKRLEAKAT